MHTVEILDRDIWLPTPFTYKTEIREATHKIDIKWEPRVDGEDVTPHYLFQLTPIGKEGEIATVPLGNAAMEYVSALIGLEIYLVLEKETLFIYYNGVPILFIDKSQSIQVFSLAPSLQYRIFIGHLLKEMLLRDRLLKDMQEDSLPYQSGYERASREYKEAREGR